MARKILPLCLLLLASYCSFGQSETHDFITYDTTINFNCFTGASGCAGNLFTVRISRPRNYFVPGNPDTASRPWIVSMQGAGEVGTDTAILHTYGPDYWLQHGWDGGVQLRNGRHYPILVTIMATVTSPHPGFVQALMDSLIRHYHPRANSMHLAGLSQGVWTLAGYMQYSATAGDEHNMANVRSLVDLQGVNPDNHGVSPYTFPTFFGHWAKRYGGRFFGLEGNQDSRNIWLISGSMQDSVLNSAYFCYETLGGGAHCCWNSMYDPSVTNWQCLGTVTNPNIYPSFYQHPSLMGTYTVDPVTGTNIFQWMLRQGDTTLVGSGTPPNQLPVANAGTDKTITLPTDSVIVTGSGTDADGTIAAYAWTKISGTGGTIASPSSATTTFKGLSAGTYQFVLTVTDNVGGTGKDTVQVTVNPANIPPTVTAGPDKTVTLPVDSVVLLGNATGNSGATIHLLNWTLISGPNVPTIVQTNSNQTATIHGLIQGTYVFALTATDSHGLVTSDSAVVTVLAASIPPTVSAGSDKTITLPVDSVVLTGSATGNGGATIHILTWATISGPNAPTIVYSNSNQTATIHGLVQGTYVFAITATDSHGLSRSDSATVTVNPAAVAAAPKILVAPGEYQVFFIDTSKHLYAVGTNLNTLGVGGTGIPGTALPVAVPSNLTFRTAAGALHGGAAIDMNGNVWSWGDNDQGQVGNGTVSTSQVLTPVQVTTDSAGNPFTGITAMCAYFSGNTSEGWYAVKSDSTLWVWGQTLGGMRGNGTAGSTSLTRPAQVPIPGNRKIRQVIAGNELILLCTDSTVWTCGGSGTNAQNLGYTVSGNSYLSLQQLTTLSGITQIAGGANFNYALKSNGTLYGWGYYGYYMGGTGGTNTPLATPTDLTTRLNLPHPIKTIVTNMVCTHAILSDSTLWGWGDNAQGGIGIGTELNFATTATPYAWDYYPAELLQQSPVQVTTRKDFVAIFATQPFVMYDYAETASGQLYSWGRNKGAVLGNGVVGCSSDVVGAYPNSWDVTLATAVNPLSLTSTTVGPCPYCVANPTSSPCNTCSTGSATTPSLKTDAAAGLQSNEPGHVISQFSVNPSIARDGELLHLSIASDNLGSLAIQVYNMNGKLIRTFQSNKTNAYFDQSVNIGHVAGGMYVVKALIGGKEQLTAKFIRR